jgi:ubiquitin-protein ligase
MSIRDKRLEADYEKVRQLSERVRTISIDSTRGTPPYCYDLTYHCRSIIKLDSNKKPVYHDIHRVRIELPQRFPIDEPKATMITPLYHPHVYPSLKICIGRKWIPAEHLDLFLLRIGSIIKFDPNYFDFNSPANRDALEWAKKNMKLFPTDPDAFTTVQRIIKLGWKDLKSVGQWKNLM